MFVLVLYACLLCDQRGKTQFIYFKGDLRKNFLRVVKIYTKIEYQVETWNSLQWGEITTKIEEKYTKFLLIHDSLMRSRDSRFEVCRP